MKKFSRIILTLLLATMVLTSCKSQETPTDENRQQMDHKKDHNKEVDQETAKTPIRLGMMSSYDVIPFVMINELGLAQKYHIDLQLEVFTSSKDRDAAFLAGELDGVLIDPIGVSMYHNADFDVRITGITDGDFVLLASEDSEISTIEDISNHSIAISENTLIDHALDYILEANSMPLDSITKEIVPRIPDRLELLRSGQVDLGLLPEPFASIGLNDGAIYIGSANDLGLYPGVSAFAMEAITEKEEAIKGLYQAYNETVVYLNETDISTYEDIVIQAVGYPEEMAGQIVIEPFRISTLPPVQDVEKAIAWAISRGLTKPNLTYNQIVYDVYTK